MSATGFLSQLLQLAIALLLAPVLVGWVNQCRAWLSNRSAPPLRNGARFLCSRADTSFPTEKQFVITRRAKVPV